MDGQSAVDTVWVSNVKLLRCTATYTDEAGARDAAGMLHAHTLFVCITQAV